MHPFLATFVASVASVAHVASMQCVLRSVVPLVGALLKVLRDHSDWPRVKRTDDEVLRREYLRLASECLYYHPKWLHLDMIERRAAQDRAAQDKQRDASEDAAQEAQPCVDAPDGSDVPDWRRWQ